MTNTHAKAYTEVIEILSYFSKEEYSKIPIEKIEFYKNNMDKEYKYLINPKEDLSKQNISKEANAILISLFRDYFASEKQKATLKNLLRQNQLKEEKEKVEKYNPNNIFKENLTKVESTENSISMAEYKESIFTKIKNWFKRTFRIVYKHTPHGWGVYPQSAAGFPFTASALSVKGDPIADLQEDLAAEQKARATYEKLIDLCADDPDVLDPLKFLRQREVVHFQRFGEALRNVQDKIATPKFYMNSMNNMNFNHISKSCDDNCN